jgi:F-type H+-transporting ATPase subunit gamma
MPSLKALRNRITAVTAIRKITKAQQMVAAAKLRRAQEAAEAARPYAEKMSAAIGNLDRGLCGAFNTNIVRLARQHIERLLREGKDVKIVTVGRKGREQLRRQYADRIVESFDFMGIKQIAFSNALNIGRDVLARFERGEFDVATVFYSKFKSVISQVPTAQQLIPATVEQGAAPAAGTVYDYEPDEGEILADLLPRNVSVQIFRALLENAAGEMGAKMSAMDNATRNAGDVINKLTILKNRTRQAMITKELIEIISGAEAL